MSTATAQPAQTTPSRPRSGRLLTGKLTPTALTPPERAQSVVIEEERRSTRFRPVVVFWGLSILVIRCLWLGFTRTRVMRLFRKEAPIERIGEVARQFCERMGVLWIKLGQLFALRTDIIPTQICDELLKLQDRTSGFSPDEAVRLVEQELGGPVDRFFSTFQKTPIAAASTAQIHKGVLREEGVWVAIKVQRPNLERKIGNDLAMIRGMIAVAKWLSVLSYMSLDDFVTEIEDIISEEIDYRYEAANMRRMRKTLRRHNIHVPKTFQRYNTQRILVMEYITGVLMSDYLKELRRDPEHVRRWCEENNVDPDRVGRQLVYSINRQLYEDQLFHGDLHPGNIILLRNSRFAFIDFGSVGFLDLDFLRVYELFVQSLTNGEHAKSVDYYLLLQKSVPANVLGNLKEEMIRVLDNWQTRTAIKNIPYAERSVLSLFTELPKVASKYHMPANWEFLRVGRSFTTVDGSLIALKPDADFIKLTRRYLEAKHRRQTRKLTRINWLCPSNSMRQALGLMASASSENIILRGATLRRMAQVFDSSSDKVSQFFTNPFMRFVNYSILFCIAYLLLVCLHQHSPDWIARSGVTLLDGLGLNAVPKLDKQVWLVVFWVLVSVLRTFKSFAGRMREMEVEG